VAANKCFENGQPVSLRDLVTGWKAADYPPMPNHDDPVPMPERVRDRRRNRG
jgi:hypothetical protein